MPTVAVQLAHAALRILPAAVIGLSLLGLSHLVDASADAAVVDGE